MEAFNYLMVTESVTARQCKKEAKEVNASDKRTNCEQGYRINGHAPNR